MYCTCFWLSSQIKLLSFWLERTKTSISMWKCRNRRLEKNRYQYQTFLLMCRWHYITKMWFSDKRTVHIDKRPPQNIYSTSSNDKSNPHNHKSLSHDDKSTPDSDKTTSHNDKSTSQYDRIALLYNMKPCKSVRGVQNRPFTGNGDVSLRVTNSRVGPKTNKSQEFRSPSHSSRIKNKKLNKSKS